MASSERDRSGLFSERDPEVDGLPRFVTSGSRTLATHALMWSKDDSRRASLIFS